MKLHLPKALCAAVIAAVSMAASVTYAEDYTVTADQTWTGLLGDTATTTTDTISVSDGAVFTIDTGTTSHALGQLNVDGATVDVQYGDGNTSRAFVTGTTISLTNNSKMTLNVLDSAGWGQAGFTFSTLNLENSTLELKARQTWGANINLNGGATIKNTDTGAAADTKLDVLQGNMTMGVTGQNNAITAVLNLRSNLTINNGGGLSLANITSGGSGTLTINANGGGTLNITGNVDRGVNLKIHENGGHTINFGGGEGTRAYVNSIEMGDQWSNNTLNVLAGYTVAITGSNNGNNTQGGYKTASLLLGEWYANTAVNINGSLLSQNACLTTGDYGGYVNIENGGMLAVQGIMRAYTGVDARMELTLKDGGTLILGNKGITFEGSGPKKFDLQGGTLGISADSTVNVDLTISGNVTVDTDTYTFSDEGGTISKGGTSTAGTLTLNGALNGTGTISTTGSGTLALGETSTTVSFDLQGGSLALGGTLTLDGSSLTASAGKISITSSDLANFTIGAASFKDVDGSTTSGNGFDNGSERIIVSGGTLDSDVTVDVEGTTFTINNDSRSIVAATSTDYSAYFLNTGSATVSTVQGAATAAGGSLSAIHMAGGTTLNADASLEDGQSISLSGNATANIGADATVKKAAVTLNGNTLTLTGSGRYEAGNSMDIGATLAEGWTGTVVLKSAAFDDSNRFGALKDLANADSWVELDSCTGYLYRKNGDSSPEGYESNDGSFELATNLVMAEGTALTINNGNSGRTAILSGTVKGKGAIQVTASGPDNLHTAFTGDISGWTGDFIMATSGKTHHLELTGTSDIASKNIKATAGTLNVTIGADVESDVEAITIASNITQDGGTVNLYLNNPVEKNFTGTVEVNNLSVFGTATMASLDLTGDATIAGALTVTGDTTLHGGTITLNPVGSYTTGKETVDGIDKEDLSSSVTISGTGKVSVGNKDMTYTNALIDVTQAGDVEINASLANSKVKNSNEGASVSVSANSLTDGTASLDAAEGDITISTTPGETANVAVANLDVAAEKVVDAGGTGTVSVSGTAAIANEGMVNGNLTVTGTLKLDAPSADTAFGAIVNGDLDLTGATITTTLSETEVLDLSGYTTNTTLVLATANSITGWTEKSVQDFFGADKVTLADGMKGVVTVADYGVSQYDFAGTSGQQLVISLTQAPADTLTATTVTGGVYDAANHTLALTASVDDVTAITLGSKLDVVFDSEEVWKAIVNGQDIYQNATVTLTLEDLNGVSLTVPGSTVLSFYGYEGTGTDGEYFVAYIPEPATSTLSVLALAALAMRRRRKH